MTQYFPQGQQGAAGEDSCQRVTYSWDTNPINASFSHYSYGRLTAVRYGLTTGNTSPYRTFCVSGTQNSYFTLGYLAGMWVETSFAEMYSYQPAGAVTAKQLGVARNSGTNPCYCNFGSSFNATLEVDYTYDSAGRTTSTTYPMTSVVPVGGVSSPMGTVTLTYGYDSLGRPNSLTDQSGASGAGWRQTSGSVNWVQNVQYDYAGRLSSIQSINGSRYAAPNYSPTWTQETMNYNVSGQLNSLGWAFNPNGAGFGTASAITYAYSATQNNGQITQVQDQLSGETISYQYDALKRLSSASSTPISGSTPTAWTQGYQFDGFGNLTAKVLNGTSAALPVNAATNQLSNASYDANGNMTSGSGATLTYDEANRVFSAQETSGGIEYYGYTADSKRFYKYPTVGTEQLTFYGARGEKLGVYALGLQSQGGPLAIWPVETNIWFAGKLIVESNEPAYLDRLGTNRGGYFSGSFSGTGTRFYPYGDEITSTVNDHEKFATYTRDGYTGLDYADQRYYASSYGRFNTADQYMASANGANNPGDPGTFNRYVYVAGDPVNRVDPTGRMYELTCGGFGDEGEGGGNDDCFGGGGGGWDYWGSICGPGWMTDASLSGPCFNDGISPSAPQAPQKGAPPPAQACQNWCLMPAAEAQALFDLADKPDCAENFNGHDPAAVLTSVITGSMLGTGSIYGSINFGSLTSNKAAVTASNGGFLRRRRTSTITINTYVDPTHVYWNTGYATYNAITLLHELGHLFSFDFGPGSTTIMYDALPNGDPNPVAEANNARAIASCGP